MNDAEQLRDRAAKLFALALKAREREQPEYAVELTQFASEALAHAEDIERRGV